jgi:AcrR family transcriptional regulator
MDRTERRLAAREGILAAAHRQVADGGWEAAAVAAVAARAGVAAGSLYRHFPSRELLLAEVLRNAAGGELTVLLRAAGPPERAPTERLEAVVRAFCARAAEPRLLRALWLDPVPGAAAAARAEARGAHHRLLGGLAADGAARGAWPAPADPALTGAALFGALVEATVAPAPPGRTASPAASAAGRPDALVALCLSAVRGPTARAPRR